LLVLVSVAFFLLAIAVSMADEGAYLFQIKSILAAILMMLAAIYFKDDNK